MTNHNASSAFHAAHNGAILTLITGDLRRTLRYDAQGWLVSYNRTA